MSGIEIVGLAASVVQLAEVGLKLSLKLYTFTRKIKSADKDIDALSHEIAATGAVLQELGSTLNDAQSVKVCSPKAITTAESLVNDCKGVFDRLEGMIESHNPKASGNKLKLRQRFSFTLVESQIQVARANLERLKSSLLVILNVLIYAEQLRSHQALPILQDQQQLLKSLVDEKAINEKRYADLMKMIQDKENFKPTATPPPYHSFTVIPNTISSPETTLRSSDIHPSIQPFAKSINSHSMLVTDLLDKVASNPYQVSYKHKMELHHGILDVHWKSWTELRNKHGHEALAELISGFSDVTQHWAERAEPIHQHNSEQANILPVNEEPQKETLPRTHQSVPPLPSDADNLSGIEPIVEADMALITTENLLTLAEPSEESIVDRGRVASKMPGFRQQALYFARSELSPSPSTKPFHGSEVRHGRVGISPADVIMWSGSNDEPPIPEFEVRKEQQPTTQINNRSKYENPFQSSSDYPNQVRKLQINDDTFPEKHRGNVGASRSEPQNLDPPTNPSQTTISTPKIRENVLPQMTWIEKEKQPISQFDGKEKPIYDPSKAVNDVGVIEAQDHNSPTKAADSVKAASKISDREFLLTREETREVENLQFSNPAEPPTESVDGIKNTTPMPVSQTQEEPRLKGCDENDVIKLLFEYSTIDKEELYNLPFADFGAWQLELVARLAKDHESFDFESC